jgi:hypothetical protein
MTHRPTEAYLAKSRAGWQCETCHAKHGDTRMLRAGGRTYTIQLAAVQRMCDGKAVLAVMCERCRNRVPSAK